MIKTSIETKVGILFFITLVILGVFVYLLGIFNPFTPTYKLKVVFNYAGGLSIGSPVKSVTTPPDSFKINIPAATS